MAGYKLEDNFKSHPVGEGQRSRMTDVREEIKHAAEAVLLFCPTSREQSLALTKLEEAQFWANAAIAREEKKNE